MRRWGIALFFFAALGVGSAHAQLVDLNTATKEEIESLPGIGEKMAEEIINKRPFGQLDELLQIPRFGEKRLAQIRELVTLSGGDVPPASDDAEDLLEATPVKPAPPSVSSAATDWKTPAGMTRHQCWRCGERFCVEASTQSGICPYCGVQWAAGGQQ